MHQRAGRTIRDRARGAVFFSCAAALGVVLGTAETVHAAVRYASATGTDGPACGTSSAPCRTISQAIVVAVAGDRIVVRPGFYSNDLDGDGIFGEPGEEPGAIGISKRLTVESSDGAAATFLTNFTLSGSVVSINTAGAVFGKKNKGFTVSLREGITGIFVNADDVEVAGNVLTNNPASGASSGAFAVGILGARAFVHDNRVIGYNVSDKNSLSDIGFFVVTAPELVLDRNTVSGCQIGFVVAAAGAALTRNVAIGNLNGFTLADVGRFTGNAALGNVGTGVTVNAGAVPTVFTKNTFAGNGPAGSNCGLQNSSGGNIVATGSFWGTASGPGPNPADQACNAPGSTTVTSPFATKDGTPLQTPLR